MTNSRSRGICTVADLSDLEHVIPRLIFGDGPLSSHDRQICRTLASAAGFPGEPKAVMSGSGSWDLRPIVVKDGEMLLLRFADPESTRTPDVARTLLSCQRLLSELQPTSGVISGEVSGRPWSARPLYRRMLAGPGGLGDARGLDPGFPGALVSLVLRMLDAGQIHGHLSPHNIAVSSEGFPILLDAGFRIASNRRIADSRFCAPELGPGSRGAVGTELYSLAKLVQVYFSHTVSNAEQLIVERMLQPNPALRPTLREVREGFASLLSHATAIGATPVAGVGTGRLLSTPGAAVGSTTTRGALLGAGPKVTKAGPASKAESRQRQPNTRIRSVLAGMLLLAVAGLSIRFWWGDPAGLPPQQSGSSTPYAEYWASGRLPLMKQVADAAFTEDRAEAIDVIFKNAMSAEPDPRIRAEIIRVACDPRWCAELSELDQQAVIMLALGELVAATHRRLPEIDSLHPGVLLALARGIRIGVKSQVLDRVSIERLEALPDPIGAVFGELARLGVGALGTPPALGAAHLAAGDAGRESVWAAILDEQGGAVRPDRIIALARLSEHDPAVAEQLLAAVGEVVGDPIAEAALWFSSEDAADWMRVPALVRLGLIIEIWSPKGLALDQLVDLLRFPVLRIREQATTEVTRLLSGKVPAAVIDAVSQRAPGLSRGQATALVLGLAQEGELRYSLIDAWFESVPDEASVVALLQSSATAKDLEAFDVAAARFLSSREWRPALGTLRMLATHREPLVRALVYSNLDAAVPAERKLIVERAAVEPDGRLRAGLRQKLLAEKERETGV